MNISNQYIAGFFDGEGSIGIYNRKGRYYGTCIRVQLCQNKTKESSIIFNFLKKKYGGNLSDSRSQSEKGYYNWQLNIRMIPKFLRDILPYLIIKKKQAVFGLNWIKNKPVVKRNNQGRILKFTRKEKDFIKKSIYLMKEMKYNP